MTVHAGHQQHWQAHVTDLPDNLALSKIGAEQQHLLSTETEVSRLA